MTSKQMTKAEFRDHWMRQQETIATAMHLLMEVQSKEREEYEGVLGEAPPAYEPRLIWDDEPERAA